MKKILLNNESMKAFIGVCLAVILFYFWTATSGEFKFNFYNYPNQQYNALASAFLKGRLDVSIIAPKELTSLPNPYNPMHNEFVRRMGFQDYVYYKSKFYVYFGPAPVLFLYLPFKLFTGFFVPDNFAIILFSISSLLAYYLFLVFIKEKNYPTTPSWLIMFFLFVASVANIKPFLLRCGSMYEVAISSSSFLLLTSILLFSLAFGDSSRKKKFIYWGSLFLGLAVGARFYYLFASLVLLKIVFSRINDDKDLIGENENFLLKKCLIYPFSIILISMFFYNYLRFDNFMENGSSYQLTGFSPKMFYPEGSLHNFYNYVFTAPILKPNFPFIYIDYWRPHFYVYAGLERIVGIVFLFPLFIINSFFCKKLYKDEKFPKFEFNLLFFSSLINFICLLNFQYVTMRYVGDFIDSLILLTFIVFMALYSNYSNSGIKKVLLLLFAVISGVYSILLGVAISITGLNHGLQYQNPVVFEALNKFFLPISKAMYYLSNH